MMGSCGTLLGIREKNGDTTKNVGENGLKWYGHVVGMEDNRWPKRITAWPQEEKRRRG
jgi:hypothetical protein